MSLRVLLVENEDEVATVVEDALLDAGYFGARTRDGETALREFHAEAFDVVLVAGVLPGMSGIDVCAGLRAMPGTEQVGIVIMSAAFHTSDAMRDAYVRAGADAFFHKPFVMEELVEGVAALVEHKRSLEVMEEAEVMGDDDDALGLDVEIGRTAIMPKPGALPVGVQAPLPVAVPAVPEPFVGGSIANHVDVVRALTAICRARSTGVLKLHDGGSRMELAVLRGVVVGGWDNLREHLLGERLWRRGILTADQMRRLNERISSKGERVAEALIALGLCDARTALTHIEDQARDRARRALAWKGGTISFDKGTLQVDKLAVASVDALEEILSYGLLPVHAALAKRFLVDRAATRVWRGADYDDGLVLYARLKPASPLIAPLQVEGRTVEELVSPFVEDGGLDLYALWLAGVVRTDPDPTADPRPLPRPFTATEAAASVVDVDAVAKVAGALLRARGRTFYEIIGADPASTAESVAVRMRALREDVGIEVLGKARLGPARAAARELWSILDEAEHVLLDPERRAAYDEDVQSTRIAAQKAQDFRPEQDFLDGQMSLALGDVEGARDAFERAVAGKQGDSEYIAYLGWAIILEGKEPLTTGIAKLHEALHYNPQAMRPVFFMGLAAQRAGDIATARSWMEEAMRRAPDDADVKSALLALPADPV